MTSRIVKIGPNRYRVNHASDSQKKKRAGKPWAITGKRQPVPLDLRDPDKKYCNCGRELNSGNKSGTCNTCRKHR